MQLLSIIIVNFNSVKLILDCLQTLKAHSDYFSYEVIVVDNTPGDPNRELIAQSHFDVNWIDMGYNAGFSRANNAGMRAASGDVYLLLNPDTLAVDDSITRCYYQLKQSDFVAAGVQLLDEFRQPQISGSFFMKGGLNHLLPLPYWGNLLRWIGYQAKTKVPNVQQAKTVEEVDWISGAFLMVKKEAVKQAGLMDEDFFLYAEEVEWCSRLKKFGRLCIFGDLNIIHLEGATINKSQNIQEKGYYNLYDKKGLQLMVSNHLRVRKQYGVGWFLFLLFNYTWGVFVYFIVATLHKLFTLKSPIADWQKAFAFGKNIFRLWLISPKIISNKPYFYKVL